MKRGITDNGMYRIAKNLEAASDEKTFAKVDLILQHMGAEDLVDELIKAMSFEEANANLDHIMQMWDISVDGGFE